MNRTEREIVALVAEMRKRMAVRKDCSDLTLRVVDGAEQQTLQLVEDWIREGLHRDLSATEDRYRKCALDLLSRLVEVLDVQQLLSEEGLSHENRAKAIEAAQNARSLMDTYNEMLREEAEGVKNEQV